MKKIKNLLNSICKSENYLASFAMLFVIVSANTKCCCIFHQPDQPNLEKFRKF